MTDYSFPISKPAAAPVSVKLRRATKSALPFVGAAAVGALAYHASPDFRDGVNWVRSALNHYPRTYEMATSGVIVGLFPDYLAQRYEGKPLSLRRSLGMFAIGAIAGGVASRGLYDLQSHYTGGRIEKTVKQILGDQAVFSPISLFGYLTIVNFIKKPAIASIFDLSIFNGIGKKMLEIFPLSFAYWSFLALPIIYNLPHDLKVYGMQFFSLPWFCYQSKAAYAPAKDAPLPSAETQS